MNDFIYEKVGWVDHTTEKPGVYREVPLPDGSILHVPDEGEILDEGTPMNARTFGHMDEGIYQASKRGKKNTDDITSLAVEVAILKNASLNNFTHNIFIVNFANLDSVELAHGVYDEAQKRVVI